MYLVNILVLNRHTSLLLLRVWLLRKRPVMRLVKSRRKRRLEPHPKLPQWHLLLNRVLNHHKNLRKNQLRHRPKFLLKNRPLHLHASLLLHPRHVPLKRLLRLPAKPRQEPLQKSHHQYQLSFPLKNLRQPLVLHRLRNQHQLLRLFPLALLLLRHHCLQLLLLLNDLLNAQR